MNGKKRKEILSSSSPLRSELCADECSCSCSSSIHRNRRKMCVCVQMNECSCRCSSVDRNRQRQNVRLYEDECRCRCTSVTTRRDRRKMCVCMRMNVVVVAPLWPHDETDAKCAFVCGWMSMSLHRCDHTNRQRQNVRMNAAVVVAVAAFASAMATGAPFLFGDLRDRALLARGRGGLLRPAFPPYSGFHFFCHQDLRWFKFSEPFVFFPPDFLLVVFILWGGGSEGGGRGGGGEKVFANIRKV